MQQCCWLSFSSSSLFCLFFHDGAESWRRGRRRRACTPQECKLSSWDSWSSCSASTCRLQGSQSRSRSGTSYASCGGACTELYESQQYYGSSIENCQLSLWSASPAIRRHFLLVSFGRSVNNTRFSPP